MLAETVLMIALAHYDHLRMVFEASHNLVGHGGIGGKQELQRCIAHADEWEHIGRRFAVTAESWICVWFTMPFGCVNDIWHSCDAVDRKLSAAIHIVWQKSCLVLFQRPHVGIGEMTCDDNRYVVASNVQDRMRGASLHGEIVEVVGRRGRDKHVVGTVRDVITEFHSHRNFLLWSLAERNPDSVAKSIG